MTLSAVDRDFPNWVAVLMRRLESQHHMTIITSTTSADTRVTTTAGAMYVVRGVEVCVVGSAGGWGQYRGGGVGH